MAVVFGFVALASAATIIRWKLSVALRRPYGTLLVNVAGAFALGWLSSAPQAAQTVVGVAGLGALTTFSTLVFELVELWDSDRPALWVYASLTLGLGLPAAWVGLQLAG